MTNTLATSTNRHLPSILALAHTEHQYKTLATRIKILTSRLPECSLLRSSEMHSICVIHNLLRVHYSVVSINMNSTMSKNQIYSFKQLRFARFKNELLFTCTCARRERQKKSAKKHGGAEKRLGAAWVQSWTQTTNW